MALEMKQAARRQKVYLLWMLNNSEQKIADDLNISVSTVKRDLEAVANDLAATPTDWAPLRKEAMNSLRATKTMILGALDQAKQGSHVQANLLKILADVDVRVLARVAQPPKIGRKYDVTVMKEEALIIAGFVSNEHPELLDEFQNYLVLKRKEKRKLEAKTS